MNFVKNILNSTTRTMISVICLGILFWQNVQAQRATKEYSSDVATSWYNLQLYLIPTTSGFTPPVASRALGYSSLTLYESVVNGMPDYRSLVGILNEFKTIPKTESGKTYHWVLAANASQAAIIKRLYANTSKENMAKIDSLKGVYERKYQYYFPLLKHLVTP